MIVLIIGAVLIPLGLFWFLKARRMGRGALALTAYAGRFSLTELAYMNDMVITILARTWPKQDRLSHNVAVEILTAVHDQMRSLAGEKAGPPPKIRIRFALVRALRACAAQSDFYFNGPMGSFRTGIETPSEAEALRLHREIFVMQQIFLRPGVDVALAAD